MRTAPFLIADLLASGALVPILPRLPAEGFEINAFYPSRRHLSPKVRAFIDMLVDRFGEQERPFGPGLVTVFLAHERMTACHRECRKIDQSMPIAAETEPIANQRNSCFNQERRLQCLCSRISGSLPPHTSGHRKRRCRVSGSGRRYLLRNYRPRAVHEKGRQKRGIQSCR
jgi:LysR substrate binding domain